jgi:hypothetical protein
VRRLRRFSEVRAARKEGRGARRPCPSFLVSYFLLVVKDHTLAVSIWLPTRSATSAATIAL